MTLDPTAQPPVDGARREEPAGRWRRFMVAISDAGELAKLLALLLAVVGFLAIYFPGIRQAYERKTMPTAWYNVLLMSGPWTAPHPYMGARPRGFESPAWADGLNADVLYALPGQMIYSSDIAVGRQGPSPRHGVTYIYDKNVCLYVRNLHFSVTRRPGAAAVSLDQLRGSGIQAHASLLALLPADVVKMAPGSCVAEDEARAAARRGDAVRKRVCPRISVWAEAQKISC